MATCCCSFNGVKCASSVAKYRVTRAQMQRAVAAPRKKASTMSYDFATESKGYVCGECVFDVVAPHINEAYKEASGNEKNLRREDFIMGVLEATGTHESQTKIEEPTLSKRQTTTTMTLRRESHRITRVGPNSYASQDTISTTF